MAPSRAVGRNKREADYSNIGVAGRKTGIMLQDSGIRDEHGMEPIDGIFSSPAKSPLKRNGLGQDSTITEEEDMDIGHSTIPDPAEILTAHRSRSNKTILPPPRARSPIKTTLNSSPRRSVGPLSSPMRRETDTPTRAMSHPLVNRRLDFATDDARLSIERSPQKGRSLLSSSSSAPRNGKLLSASGNSRKRPFDLNPGKDEEDTEITAMSGVDMNGDSGNIYDDSQSVANGEELLQVNTDSEIEEMDETQQDLIHEEVISEVRPKTKRGRPRRNVSGKAGQFMNLPTEADAAASRAPAAQKRAARAPKAASVDRGKSYATQVGAPTRRGRPPKNVKPGTFPSNAVEEQEEASRPAKRARHESVNATPTISKRKGPKPPPSERDPNAKITSVKKGKTKAMSTEPEPTTSVLGRPKPRSLFVLRSETPADDGGAITLKSGRTSVKPMAWWRGERCVFGEGNIDGSHLVLPGIKEVIRTEEVEAPRPRRPAGKRGATRKRRPLDDVEEEDEDQELWEMGEGVLRAEVMPWDYVTGRGLEDRTETIELAFAHTAIQAATREVRGAEFRYAKTLTLPFFGSGMVDLPPGGEKRVKNSRKMQMVFFVFCGRVRVDVAGTTFSVGRGGMWQVPRGNFYSIANQHQTPARIFFAQGCQVSTEAAAADESVVA